MKHMKTTQVPAREKLVLDKVTCDLCGDVIDVKLPKVDEVVVRHRVGKYYPPGGCGEETSVDMCCKCFEEKLVPWLRSQGAEPRIDDWEC